MHSPAGRAASSLVGIFSERSLARLGDWVAEERALPGPPWPLNALLLAIVTAGPLPLVALIFDDQVALFWLVMVADLVLLFGVAVATFRTPALFVAIMVIWFALQRLVVALVAPEVSADLVRLLLTYKEGFYLIVLAAGAIGVAVRHQRGEEALPVLLAGDYLAVAFLGWLAIHFVSDPQSSSPELTYLRRFAAPVLLYLGGRLLIRRPDQLIAAAQLLLVVAVGVAAFGLLERFVFDIAFWRDTVDASAFYNQQVDSGLLPENWTVIYRGVPDGIFIALPLGEPVRRLVSTYLEPTTLSSFLAFALLLIVFVPDVAWGRGGKATRVMVALAAFAIGLAILATLSRGGMVTFLAATGLVLAVRWLRSPGPRISIPQPLVLLPLVVVIGLGAAITTFSDFPAKESVREVLATRAVSGLSDEPPASGPSEAPPTATDGPLEVIEVHPPGSTADAAEKHLRGLTTGLEEMLDHPLGRGLGATGNWSETPETGSESTVGVLAAQTGIAGFALYVGFFAAVIAGLVVAGWRQSGMWSDLTIALAGGLFGLFIISCVSESASGLLGNAFYLLFAGWALSLTTPARKELQFSLFPAVDGEAPTLDEPVTASQTKG
jgi:hypothetical protein